MIGNVRRIRHLCAQVAFQNRNPIHRAHFELLVCAKCLVEVHLIAFAGVFRGRQTGDAQQVVLNLTTLHVEEPPSCLGLVVQLQINEAQKDVKDSILPRPWQDALRRIRIRRFRTCPVARLVHPTCGPTQPGDIDGLVRIQTYEACEVHK